MADISRIMLPNGSAYGFKDLSAQLSCALLANSKADISSVSKVFVKDAGAAEYSSGKQSDLSVIKLADSEYEQLVINGMTSPNALYLVSSDYNNAYGEQLKNLAAATDLSDAVTLEQLNSLSSKFYQLPANGIPGSDMALSVQTAIEKAEASISSIPDPIDPLSATFSGQYADALATKNALSARIADMLSTELDRQFDAKIPYAFVEPEISGTTSLSIQLQNYAINSISVASSATQMVVIFPQKIANKSRDFYVRLTLSSTTSIPTMTFQEQDGSNVSFDAGNDTWADIDSGVNLLLFTETAQ